MEVAHHLIAREGYESAKKMMQNYSHYHCRKYDGNSIVRVRAQVMMRDDSTDGWFPMGGGGLSNVSVRKRKIHHEEMNDQPCKHEYLIYGKRISDQSVVLQCTIKKDFEYNKVMPTFHHWKTGNKKFGLTFQTAADARAFDKGVRLAIEDLLDANSLACPHKHYRGAKKKGVSETSPLHQYNLDVGEDDVFMQLDLPVDKPNTEPLSRGIATPTKGGVGPGRSPSPPSSSEQGSTGQHHHNLHQHMPVSLSKSASPSHNKTTPTSRYLLSSSENLKGGGLGGGLPPVPHPRMSSERSKLLQDKDYSYVKFPPSRHRMEPPHEYSYPKLIDAYKTESATLAATTPPLIKPGPPSGSEKGNGGNSSSSSSTSSKKSRRSLPSLVLPCVAGSNVEEEPSSSTPPFSGVGGRGILTSSPASNHGLLENLETSTMTLTCAHCHESFSHASNRRGACGHAPQDWARSTVETVTCLSCAKCLLYHCMSDSDGDYGAGHPCDCSSEGGGTWGRRWLGLTLLSILVPCLCCYFPMMACYKGGAACSLCGGRHQAASPSPK